MVEDEQRVRDEKQHLRQVEFVGRRRRHGALEKPHRVVPEEPDRAARERRQRRATHRLGGSIAGEQLLQFLKRIALGLKLPARAVLFRDDDGLAAALENRGGTVAQK